MDVRTREDMVCVLRRWLEAGRTVVAVLHDLELVRAVFLTTTLLARELVAHGPTQRVLTGAHLLRARQLQEAFDEQAELCDVGSGAGTGEDHHGLRHWRNARVDRGSKRHGIRDFMRRAALGCLLLALLARRTPQAPSLAEWRITFVVLADDRGGSAARDGRAAAAGHRSLRAQQDRRPRMRHTLC
ncbi:MAG: hypothetical protein ACUVVU_07190 [Tepidimonas sp.]|uniref:hypothetical protein n=1 Tax=Tepidimonas sp. TaxID=2002775 RepID=UPI004054D15C